MNDAKQPAPFLCLRCGHEYSDVYVPRMVVERTCPECGSNSVRRLKVSRVAKKV